MLCIKCKKHKFPLFNCNNINYCTNHSKLLLNNFVIKIQKIYRGYRRRKYVKTIYARLPCDLRHHILNFNVKNTKNYDDINLLILKKTHKIKDLSTIEDNEITLAELTNIITMLNKYYHVLNVRWLNYYKYYFNNIYSILLILCEVHDLPYSFTHIVSTINNDIYESLDFITNSSNNESNDFTKEAKEIMLKINNFLGDSKRTILVI